MKKILFFGFLFLSIKLIGQTLTTYNMDAPIYGLQSVYAEVGSCMDKNHNIHIAWIKSTGTATEMQLMYSFFDSETKSFTSSEITISDRSDIKQAPYILTDANNNPHIVIFVKRDKNRGTKSGNNAVIYAGDSDGDGVFEISQASANALDPANNTESLFNCWVNGRPNIYFTASNEVVVEYYGSGQDGADCSQCYHSVTATKSGASWTRELQWKEYDLITCCGNYNETSGTSFPPILQNNLIQGFIYGNTQPAFAYKTGNTWEMTKISEYYSTNFENDNVKIVISNDGITHFLWEYNGINNDKFCHTIINGSSYSAVEETILQNSPAGNMYGSTVDLVTGLPVYLYGKSSSTDCYIIIDNVETKIPDVGEIMGRQSIHVDNGFVAAVTANESKDKIFVTISFDCADANNSSITQTSCESFTLNGETFTTSGVYTQTLTNAAGCDSIVTLDLTINTVDASVVVTDNTLEANTTGASYQWIDCDNSNSAIAGEISQSFAIKASGNYAVIVTENGCTATSVCTQMDFVGLTDVTSKYGFVVYPNPADNWVTVKVGSKLLGETFRINDPTGKTILTSKLVDETTNFNLSEFPSGIYFIKVGEHDQQPFKVVKK
ncbi:MAG: T9SS type A sorting domain-containing protein [Salinivirgaceae bacterium]